MVRRPRNAEEGGWFHVTNRALARRTMFENDLDMGVFLDGVRAEVERSGLEVHAFTLLATHFHLLVRCGDAALSDAMHAIQLPYVRYFNRGRRRDGPLLRGRFWSRRVDSLAYRRVLVGYIDANPVQARLAPTAADYPYGSCHHYANATAGPDWLAREWIEREVRSRTEQRHYDPSRYQHVFARGFPGGTMDWLDRRRTPGKGGADPTDMLLAGAAPAVLSWVRSKARLADGVDTGWQLVPASALAAIEAPQRRLRGKRTTWHAAGTALLLRDLAGLSFQQVGVTMRRTGEAARRIVAAARSELAECGEFASWVAATGHAAMLAVYGPMLRTAANVGG
jgi:REP element-mobilizing transposase RayT